jgi:uncharacterized protein YutE (UPF0331/DUF86 family)
MTRGRPDPEVVRRHLLALNRALQTLDAHRDRPVEALRSDPEELWIVERGLQLCAQNALDVASHLVASTGRDVPDYASAIDGLSGIGVLSSEFAVRFRGVAGLRNVLVRGYLDVDPALIHSLLNERLGEFEEFARQVEAYLERSEAGGAGPDSAC